MKGDEYGMEIKCEWASQFLMSEKTCEGNAVMYALTEKAWRKRGEGVRGGFVGAFLCQPHADEMIALTRVDLSAAGDATSLIYEYVYASREVENVVGLRQRGDTRYAAERAGLDLTDWWYDALERRSCARIRLSEALLRSHLAKTD